MSTAIFWLRRSFPVAAITLIVACGSEPRESAPARDAPSASQSSGKIEPCRLATAEEVARVLPNSDGGSKVHAGPSLMKGIDAYQCSYSNPASDLLTVIVHVAADKERFDAIRKSRSFHSSHKAVSIADAAWVWGDPDDVKIQVEKGWAILDLELMAKGAADRTDALIALAKAVAAKVP